MENVCRDKFLRVRLNERELACVRDNADRIGCSVSDYVRSLLLVPVFVDESVEVGEGVGRIVIYDKETMLDIRRLLRTWGRYYKQAVDALGHIKSQRFMTPEDTYELFSRACTYLAYLQDIEPEFKSLVDKILDSERVCLEHNISYSEPKCPYEGWE